MGKFSGVLLATDYDDTLYSSDCTIPQENRQAIARLCGGRGPVLHLHRPPTSTLPFKWSGSACR